MSTEVKLIAVDEETLERLVAAAIRDAYADEVTAPVTEGNVWTQERVDWLRLLHRADRAGIDGPKREATWAVVFSHAPLEVIGQARLKSLDEPGTYETGMWLTRSVRGRGVGQRVIAAVADRAWQRGGMTLVADTTAANPAAVGALRGMGFDLEEHGAAGDITARLELGTAPH